MWVRAITGLTQPISTNSWLASELTLPDSSFPKIYQINTTNFKRNPFVQLK